MDAKDFLREAEKIDLRIKNKLIEKQQWRDIALGITANMEGERVQSSGTQSKIEDAICKCIDMESEIDELIDRLIAVKKEIVSTIEKLDNAVEYNILHMRYIQYIDLQQIAEYYHKDYGWATTTHGRALRNVQSILDGKKKVCDLV